MKLLLIASVVVFLTGCGLLTSIHRTLDINDGKGALIDIKQRAIIVRKNDNTAHDDPKFIVCAEPSPDAMSSYAAEMASSFSLANEAQAELAAAIQEQSAFVGLRTQSIQLLRDSLYRLCESRMSGALTDEQYSIIMRRYQRYMVALLAIEQLTGALRTPPITINTSGSADAAQSILALRSQLTLVEKRITELENEKNKKKPEKQKDGITEEQKKEIDTIIADYEVKITALKSDKEAIASAIENAKGVSVSGGGTTTVNTIGSLDKANKQDIQSVSKTVEKIVLKILNTDDMGQLCWEHSKKDIDNATDNFSKTCTVYWTKKLEAKNILLKARLGLIKKLAQTQDGQQSERIEHAIEKLNDLNEGIVIQGIESIRE